MLSIKAFFSVYSLGSPPRAYSLNKLAFFNLLYIDNTRTDYIGTYWVVAEQFGSLISEIFLEFNTFSVYWNLEE